MKIPAGNGIKCYQDMGAVHHDEIPAGVDWIIEPRGNHCFLRADGYGFGVPGQPKGEYGNGPVFTYALHSTLYSLAMSDEGK
jgi:hypothetical protein